MSADVELHLCDEKERFGDKRVVRIFVDYPYDFDFMIGMDVTQGHDHLVCDEELLFDIILRIIKNKKTFEFSTSDLLIENEQN